MNERPISVGDVVQVVKLPVCGCDLAMGWTFTVNGIFSGADGNCSVCSAARGPDTVVAFSDPQLGCVEIWRVKRFPPFEELDGLETQEPIRQPMELES